MKMRKHRWRMRAKKRMPCQSVSRFDFGNILALTIRLIEIKMKKERIKTS